MSFCEVTPPSEQRSAGSLRNQIEDQSADAPSRVGDVGAMLQALYDGTWLNRPGSELLLSWLAQATWRKGLVAKLPPDAEVAHKYGIRYLFDPDHPEMVPAGAPSLHLGDCGILYHPKRPMMVCVMTEATTSAAAEGVIGDVAKAAWDAATTLRSH